MLETTVELSQSECWSTPLAKERSFKKGPCRTSRDLESRIDNGIDQGEVCICAGIPWLLANLALASFIKFRASPRTAIAVTVIMGVAGLYFFLTHGRWMRYVTGSAADAHALNVCPPDPYSDATQHMNHACLSFIPRGMYVRFLIDPGHVKIWSAWQMQN